jgi:hypothetical protein
MALVADILEALVSIGTIGLAVMTYFSVLEARRREVDGEIAKKRTEHISYMLEQINDLYLPLIAERYKIFDSNPDFNSILKISSTKYLLAEPETMEAIETLFQSFNRLSEKRDPTEREKFSEAVNLLWSAVIRDYEKLLKKFYDERGIKVSNKFTLPKIEGS